MDNTKDFKDNFKYNVKKVLEIVEKSKKEKQTKTGINQNKEKE